MARRTQSPANVIATFFMREPIADVEQALTWAAAIVASRKLQFPTGAEAPKQRRRRVRTPAAAPETAVQTGTAPGAVEPTAAAPVTPVTAPGPVAVPPPPRRRRGRSAANAGTTDPTPKRRRRRGTTGATPPMGTGTTAGSAATAPATAPALPPQLVEGDDGYEPISTVVE